MKHARKIPSIGQIQYHGGGQQHLVLVTERVLCHSNNHSSLVGLTRTSSDSHRTYQVGVSIAVGSNWPVLMSEWRRVSEKWHARVARGHWLFVGRTANAQSSAEACRFKPAENNHRIGDDASLNKRRSHVVKMEMKTFWKFGANAARNFDVLCNVKVCKKMALEDEDRGGTQADERQWRQNERRSKGLGIWTHAASAKELLEGTTIFMSLMSLPMRLENSGISILLWASPVLVIFTAIQSPLEAVLRRPTLKRSRITGKYRHFQQLQKFRDYNVFLAAGIKMVLPTWPYMRELPESAYGSAGDDISGYRYVMRDIEVQNTHDHNVGMGTKWRRHAIQACGENISYIGGILKFAILHEREANAGWPIFLLYAA
ncbi:hypothetical protein EDB19DRAFT_2029630 [Suillus lakei]|nr:hypothetical protein EDB19DRAFT_2029630 [Suillus lakei]